MKIVFFGTPLFAADFLTALIDTAGIEVVGVVAQPDEPVGRKKIITAPPTKTVAQAHSIPVHQPTKLKDETFQNALRAMHADAFVVVAYGRILPQDILNMPRFGCINVHPSLLPKYRGPSPIQSAIAAGESVTGISIMRLDAEMDHGPILAQTELPIDIKETPDSLFAKVVALGAPLLISTLKGIAEGAITPKEQDHPAATYCKMLSREDGKIDWKESAETIERKIRAFTPWPGTATTWIRNEQAVQLKIFSARVSTEKLPEGTAKVLGSRLIIGTSTTGLEIEEIQPATGKRQQTGTFLQGYRDIDGAILT